jgi:hypothetical protein
VGTRYKRSQQKNRKYNKTPHFYKEDLTMKTQKAIRSSSTTTDQSTRVVAVFNGVGDETT